MDRRALDESAGIINAACRGWFVPIGGGSMALASEVKVVEYKRKAGMQARVQDAWYWLTDGQIAGMVRQSRALTTV